MQIRNPILRGFHPDPSMIRVGQEYYIATSTFEWYPGIRIYHSSDLITWNYLGAPLSIDFSGCRSSDGIWAPHLSFDGTKYYMIYTIVHGARKNPVMDVSNYLIHAEHIEGPWSKPVYLNSSGFDPSIFHDEDGKKWIINMEWDYRKVCIEEHPFTGILLQEYDDEKECLLGEPISIFRGTSIGSTEGPQLLKRNEWFYLICAEGGTGWFHAVTVARSRKIEGPYEVHPCNPILSSWDEPLGQKEDIETFSLCGSSRLKKAGHGSLCETSEGNWYLAHLCARPLLNMDYCPLGRETAIQEIEWKKDWPYLKNESHAPKDFYEVTTKEPREEVLPSDTKKVYNFRNNAFLADFQTLRVSMEELGITNRERSGYLRIYGRESIYSLFSQALLARRQDELNFHASTTFEFEPRSFQQSAGLIYRYDEENQYYAYITYNEEIENCVVNLLSVVNGKSHILAQKKINQKQYQIGVDVVGNQTQFFYMEHGIKNKIGEILPTCVLSDENADGFTGAFVGMAVQDLQSHSCYADFMNFIYEAVEAE